jgi:hypothetical protein
MIDADETTWPVVVPDAAADDGCAGALGTLLDPSAKPGGLATLPAATLELEAVPLRVLPAEHPATRTRPPVSTAVSARFVHMLV